MNRFQTTFLFLLLLLFWGDLNAIAQLNAPTLSGDTTGSVTEDAATTTVSGTLTGADVDAGDTLTYSVDSAVGTYGQNLFKDHTIANDDMDWRGHADGSIAGPQSVYAVDVDGDGDMDVLSASFRNPSHTYAHKIA